MCMLIVIKIVLSMCWWGLNICPRCLDRLKEYLDNQWGVWVFGQQFRCFRGFVGYDWGFILEKGGCLSFGQPANSLDNQGFWGCFLVFFVGFLLILRDFQKDL